MKDQSFIVYPKTKIDRINPNIEITEAPIKTKLKAFITGYQEDRGVLPSIKQICSAFGISEQDAEIALVLYGG